MHSKSALENLRSEIVSIRNMDSLPTEDSVFQLVGRTIETLNGEGKKYRPHGKNKKPGGLLDFVGVHKDVIVVPDLHSRPDFVLNLMDSYVGEKTVLQAMDDGDVIVACLGDGVHTETQGYCRDRWTSAYKKWSDGQRVSSEMKEEMLEAFQTMMVVMTLKNAFPYNFHFLKGNHENVLNRSGLGDFGFRKVAMEGQMVCDFLEDYYSQATTYLISEFEHALPIVAIFDRFGISHAEPVRSFSRKEIVDYKNHPEVIIGFTWTDNGRASDGSVVEQFRELNPKASDGDCFWIGGHRPVEGKFYLRQDGAYIQIHNPQKMNVALIHSDGRFDLERDIFSVEVSAEKG